MSNEWQVFSVLKSIISAEMPRVLFRTSEQKQNLWENALTMAYQISEELPEEISVLLDWNFKFCLGHDRAFCMDAGIDYERMDEYWDDMRAAVALRYLDTYDTRGNVRNA